jgi:hypothetical protein
VQGITIASNQGTVAYLKDKTVGIVGWESCGSLLIVAVEVFRHSSSVRIMLVRVIFAGVILAMDILAGVILIVNFLPWCFAWVAFAAFCWSLVKTFSPQPSSHHRSLSTFSFRLPLDRIFSNGLQLWYSPAYLSSQNQCL